MEGLGRDGEYFIFELRKLHNVYKNKQKIMTLILCFLSFLIKKNIKLENIYGKFKLYFFLIKGKVPSSLLSQVICVIIYILVTTTSSCPPYLLYFSDNRCYAFREVKI